MTDITRLFTRLVVSDAAGAIDFYTRAFGAVEKGDRYVVDGKVVHAEVVVGRRPCT